MLATELLDGMLSPDHRRLARLHPADIARVADAVPVRQATEILASLDDELAAYTMEEMVDERQADVVERLEPERAAHILERMAPTQPPMCWPSWSRMRSIPCSGA